MSRVDARNLRAATGRSCCWRTAVNRGARKGPAVNLPPEHYYPTPLPIFERVALVHIIAQAARPSLHCLDMASEGSAPPSAGAGKETQPEPATAATEAPSTKSISLSIEFRCDSVRRGERLRTRHPSDFRTHRAVEAWSSCSTSRKRWTSKCRCKGNPSRWTPSSCTSRTST